MNLKKILSRKGRKFIEEMFDLQEDKTMQARRGFIEEMFDLQGDNTLQVRTDIV